MIRSLLIALGLLASPAAAEVASVKGGEHPEFTRIVVEARLAGNWQFGRTVDGYELALDPGVTGFDLTEAFEKIPRDRVSGLWRDPATGRLRIALSCPCHAIAFEFRPGIVVVDVKSGPPPEGSSFELALDSPPQEAEPVEQAEDQPAPDAAGAPPDEAAADADAVSSEGYDWLDHWRDGPERIRSPVDMRQAEMAAALDPLREAMLEQISRGAAEGIVEIAEHPELPGPAAVGLSEEEGLRVALGELPGIVISRPSEGAGDLAADGTPCVPDAEIAIGDWGLPGTAAEQLGIGRSGLLSEFDVPVPDAIMRATRAYLSLTFGAEARQFLGLLEAPLPDEVPLLRAMSHIVDLEAPPENPFAGMESCDGSAALWAALAAAVAGDGAGLPNLDPDAVARSFSGLPVHLRHHFAPILVDLMLARGEEEAARILRDAAIRAPEAPGPGVGLMEARFDLATGETEAAAERAEALLDDSGPVTAEAAITLAEAAFAGTGAVDPDLPEKIGAFIRESRGTELEAPLRRALVLSLAMAGDFAGAFSELPASPGTAGDLWSLAALGADDDRFLAEAIGAVRGTASGRPMVRPDTAFDVATRLMDSGFGSEALVWLGSVTADDDAARRLLAARAQLSLGDARAALATLSGMGEPEAERLRAEAVLQLGDPAAAAEAWTRAGDTEAGARARVWTQDWETLATDGPEAWMQAAGLVAPALPAPGGGADDADSSGPLARGAALVEESAEAREAIEGLLLSIATAPSP